jgi:hypothetical protein
MNKKNNVIILWATNLALLFSISSCIPIVDSKVAVGFRNCTNDTLFIGASHYDNIDNVDNQLLPNYNIICNSNFKITNLSLWKRISTQGDFFVYPDSTCLIDDNYLFGNKDTCYFFLIKWRNAKRYSWDEIRTKKLFYRWIVTRDPEGKFDRNIRYK